jgi:hypothetical protein
MTASVGTTEEKVVVDAKDTAQTKEPVKKIKHLKITVEVEKWTAMLEAGGRFKDFKTNQFRGQFVNATRDMLSGVTKVEEV